MRATLIPIYGLAVLMLAACGGGGSSAPTSSAPPPPPVGGGGGGSGGTGDQRPLATAIETEVEAADFLRKAGLGPTESSIDALTNGSAVDWVSQQLSMAPTNYKGDLSSRLTTDDSEFPEVSQLFYEELIGTDAELRARMTFALSQIFVINGDSLFNEGYALAEWLDILDRNAFGNYRDLMGDVTRSPVMGRYLTYLYNQKGDPSRGRSPDENYAREILQLFTIGLVELNMDGTPKIATDGGTIDTYTNDDIIGLARVFTGYVLAGTTHRWQDRFDDAWERPMMMYEPNHSTLEKRFLGTVIPANTQGEATIEQALDAIFDHPNLAPFVSRQLIQRFTASDPRPEFVERVATAFETGRFTADTGEAFGTGQRGDLAATLAAILLDRTQHDDAEDAREGKVREPVLNFVQMARNYKSEDPNLVQTSWSIFADTSDISDRLGQSPLRSPSVFNFYRPGYVAPGTESGDQGLTAPELQIVNEASAVGYLNFMFDFIARESGDFTVVPDFSDEMALADDSKAMLNRIDLELTGGTLTEETRAAILDTVEALPIRTSNADRDRLSRVRLAVTMVVASPEYMTLN